MENQATSIRLTAIETRLAAIESRLSAIEELGAAKPRRKKELSPEERLAIRQRLLEGQRKKREREAAEAAAKEAEAKAQPKSNKKKGVANGTSTKEGK